MHTSVRQWVEQKVRQHGLTTQAVLEVGSYNVNGGVRDLFESYYLGVDIRPGPGVDRVVSLGCWLPHQIHGEAWDVVICLEVLEHCRRPSRLFDQMHEAVKPGGQLLLTTRGIGFPLHEHPWDLWRFTDEGLRVLAEDANWEILDITPDPQPEHPGWFLHARSKPFVGEQGPEVIYVAEAGTIRRVQ